MSAGARWVPARDLRGGNDPVPRQPTPDCTARRRRRGRRRKRGAAASTPSKDAMWRVTQPGNRPRIRCDEVDRAACGQQVAHHAGIRPVYPGHTPDEGGFTRSVRADDQREPTATHGQLDTVQNRREPVEAFRQTDDDDLGRCGGGHVSREETRSWVYGCCGSSSTCSAMPSSTMRPWCSTTIRVASTRTAARSWDTTMDADPRAWVTR